MDPRDVSNFIALLLVLLVALTAVGLARESTRSALSDAALPLIAFAAAGAMVGSLYFSERAGYIPCELCWFQRIAMYPLAIIMPIATWQRDRRALRYSLALSLIGATISAYHVQLQLFPEQSSFCEVSNPCTAEWVQAFGWMTIPQMAGLTFLLIATLSATGLRFDRHEHDDEPLQPLTTEDDAAESQSIHH